MMGETLNELAFSNDYGYIVPTNLSLLFLVSLRFSNVSMLLLPNPSPSPSPANQPFALCCLFIRLPNSVAASQQQPAITPHRLTLVLFSARESAAGAL